MMDNPKTRCYECCGIRFASSRILGSHMATCHQDGFICLKCNRTFNTPAKLRKHQLIHFSIKEFVCKICNFATVHKHNAKRHLKSHERTGNHQPSELELVCQSRSIIKSKKTAKCFIHRSRKAGNMTPGSEKTPPFDGGHFKEEKQCKRYDQNHKIAKDSRVSVHIHGKGRSGNSSKGDKSLILIRGNEVQKSVNDSATVSVGDNKRLLNSSRLREQKGSNPLTVGHISHVNELHALSGLADPSDLPTNWIQDEARQIRSRMSVLTAIPTLLPLLERLLELSASITNRIPRAIDKDVRFEALECLEYLLNTTRMSIVRWEDLIGQTARDAALSAIVYAYGTLPVFINWEKHEHLEMLENIILLILNTVKTRQSTPYIRELNVWL